MSTGDRQGPDDPLKALEDVRREAAGKKKRTPSLPDRELFPAISPSARKTRPTVPRQAVHEAVRPESPGMRAGQYVRENITLTEAQKRYIRDVVAKELDVSALEAYRWLIDLGLQAYEAGSRPETEIVSTITRSRAKKGHWSSQE